MINNNTETLTALYQVKEIFIEVNMKFTTNVFLKLCLA